MSFRETWIERFNQATLNTKLYLVYLWNEETNSFDKCLCSLECAIAYLESMATDFDFEPEKILIKQGKERIK